MKGIEKIVEFYEDKHITVDVEYIKEYISKRVCELGIDGVGDVEDDYFENGKRYVCHYEVRATKETDSGDFETEVEILSVC